MRYSADNILTDILVCIQVLLIKITLWQKAKTYLHVLLNVVQILHKCNLQMSNT